VDAMDTVFYPHLMPKGITLKTPALPSPLDVDNIEELDCIFECKIPSNPIQFFQITFIRGSTNRISFTPQ
jgi:hypothetical protein